MGVMTGKALNVMLGVNQLRAIAIQAPTSMNIGKRDLVHGIHQISGTADAEFVAATSSLRIFGSTDGAGLFLPWLSGQRDMTSGASYDLGSVTPPIASTDKISWVVTGPFSGCHAYTFESTGGYSFAHFTTAAASETICRSIPEQVVGVKAQLPGGTGTVKENIHVTPVGMSFGWVFWMRTDSGWQRRIIRTSQPNQGLANIQKVESAVAIS